MEWIDLGIAILSFIAGFGTARISIKVNRGIVIGANSQVINSGNNSKNVQIGGDINVK